MRQHLYSRHSKHRIISGTQEGVFPLDRPMKSVDMGHQAAISIVGDPMDEDRRYRAADLGFNRHAVGTQPIDAAHFCKIQLLHICQSP